MHKYYIHIAVTYGSYMLHIYLTVADWSCDGHACMERLLLNFWCENLFKYALFLKYQEIHTHHQYYSQISWRKYNKNGLLYKWL